MFWLRPHPPANLCMQPPIFVSPSLSRLFSFCIQSILYTKSKKRIFTYGDWGGGRAGTSYAMGERTGLLLTGPPHPQLVSLLFHSEKVEGKRGEGGYKISLRGFSLYFFAFLS